MVPRIKGFDRYEGKEETCFCQRESFMQFKILTVTLRVMKRDLTDRIVSVDLLYEVSLSCCLTFSKIGVELTEFSL